MTSQSVSYGTTVVRAGMKRGIWLRGTVWLLFAALVLRFLAVWTNAFTGTSLPVLDSIGLTALFAAFAVLHAASLLGGRHAITFLAICAVVTWSFEQIGVATGQIYGAYHYSDQLGLKLGAVPIVIPFAWFMMVYASWIVARLLLHGTADPLALRETFARVVVAALAMTTWDAVMDPGMALSGVWTWDQGGAYFGVPLRNYAGWLVTTLVVFAATEVAFRYLKRKADEVSGVYAGLPALVYGLVAVDRLLLPDLPELRIVAAFGMGFTALLAILRIRGKEAGSPS